MSKTYLRSIQIYLDLIIFYDNIAQKNIIIAMILR